MDVSNNIAEFQKDKVFSEFFGQEFNLQQCISSVNTLSFNEQLEKISFGIEFVKQNISILTSSNCEEFFQRTAQLDNLYQELQFIQIKAQNLSKTMESMRSKLENPYRELLSKVAFISRLQKTCDLLRKMLRIIHLSKRIYETNLKAFKAENDLNIYQRELIKTSQYLNEVNAILASDATDKQLYRIDAISKDLKRITDINEEIVVEADRLLKEGIEKLSESTIATSLQVYHNVAILEAKLDTLTKNMLQQTTTVMQKNLNTKEPIQSCDILENRLQTALESAEQQFKQMSLIFKVLKKRRDNLNQKLLVEYIPDGDNWSVQFWNQVVTCLGQQLGKICSEKPRIKRMIEENYHQILSIVALFHNRILEVDSNVVNGKNARNIVHSFESTYLSSSINSLFESVNKIFKTTNTGNTTKISKSSKKLLCIPTDADIETIVEKMKNELLAASNDTTLLHLVAKNVHQSANLFIVKCEHLALVDGDASQVIGPPSKSQLHNVTLIHSLRHFENTFRKSLSKQIVLEDIHSEFQDIHKSIGQLVSTIVDPLVSSLEDALEAIILTMHAESYSFQKPETAVSLYIRELQNFISRSYSDYLKNFGDDEMIQQQIHRLSSNTIDTFVLNTCLLTPVSVHGRHRIHQDYEAFEKSIEPLCDRIGDHSKSFQTLRALKSLILSPPEIIHKSPVLNNPIPITLIVTFLISNYGHSEISVQKHLDYSTPRYLKWYQTSSPEVITARIGECLNSYAAKVRKENRANYVEIYPILVDLLQR